MSRNQLNQKFKLMIEAPKYVIYTNTPPHTRAHWTRSVDAHMHWIFHFKWRVVEIRTCDLLSRWLLIPCQGINSTCDMVSEQVWQVVTGSNLNHPSFKGAYSAPMRIHTSSPKDSHMRGRVRIYNMVSEANVTRGHEFESQPPLI